MASSGGQHDSLDDKKGNFDGSKPAEKLNFYDIMDKMIGHNKQKFSNVIVPSQGLPIPPRSEQEIRITSFFESCAFKTTLSCVAGKLCDLY